MSVYMVFTREKTKDAQELATYNQQVPATLAGHRSSFSPFMGRKRTWKGLRMKAR